MESLKMMTVVIFLVICFVVLIDATSNNGDETTVDYKDFEDQTESVIMSSFEERKERSVYGTSGKQELTDCGEKPCAILKYSPVTKKVISLMTFMCMCPNVGDSCRRRVESPASNSVYAYCQSDSTEDRRFVDADYDLTEDHDISLHSKLEEEELTLKINK